MSQISSTDKVIPVSDKIPPNFTLSNAEEVTTVAKLLRDHQQNDVLISQVIQKISKSQFCSSFVKLYGENHDLQFRRDITFLAEIINSDTDMSRVLLKTGVVKLMIAECGVSSDKDTVVNICKTLRSSAQKSNNNKLYQVKHGVLTLLTNLIDTWRDEDNDVLCASLGLLQSSARSIDFKELLARDIADNDNNIPELLNTIMNESTNREVLEYVVNCVGNLISDTMVMYKYFTTQTFVDSSFKIIQTDVLSGPFKYKLLRFVIFRLTCNNPDLMTKLLVKHVDFLRHLSLLSGIQSSRMSEFAIDIINKYFSCKESKHECRLVSRFGLFNILRFVLFYCLDVVLDIKVGINAIVDDASTNLFTLNFLEVIAVTLLANIGKIETDKLWIKHVTYVSVVVYLISGLIFILYFTACNTDKKGKLQGENVNPRFEHFGYTLQINRRELHCHVTPKKAIQINGKKLLLSMDYKYNNRLQVMKPCLFCVLEKAHPNSKPNTSNFFSLSKGFLGIFGNFFTQNSGHRDYETLNSGLFEDNSQLAKQHGCRANRRELEWLIKQVICYRPMHNNLLKYFPGIQRFEDAVDISLVNVSLRQHLQQQGCTSTDKVSDNNTKKVTDSFPNRIGRSLVQKCKELNIFRSIEEIKDEELSPGVFDNCYKVREKILSQYIIATQGSDDVSDLVLTEFQQLCEKYFFLEETMWEEKCALWCKTAPTDVLSKHRARHSWNGDKCKEEIIKWIKSQEKKETVNKYTNLMACP
ncbi:hypothetical protein ACHWQZ_G009176 [Mnemiopsis leidyi]